ncbi:EamA family transporter RarD [bacterium]|nr:EamA family transporter RarD [bacterium]
MISQRRDVWLGITSYTLWGLFPIYWKLLAALPALEILSHRILWSFVFYLAIYLLPGAAARNRWRFASRRAVGLSVLAAGLLALNWGTYIYGVNSGRVLETSLAYFLNPLMSVAVGVIWFKEPFSWPLRFALILATLGVLTLASLSTEFPWIALTLATSFCIYGIVKKVIGIDARLGSLLEGAAGFLPALAAAIYFREAAPWPLSWEQALLLAGGGVVTGLPLFLFSVAAPGLPVSLMGMLQFIAPSLQFLCGVLVFHEPLGGVKLAAFCLIWAGVGFYLVDRMARLGMAYRNRKR